MARKRLYIVRLGKSLAASGTVALAVRYDESPQGTSLTMGDLRP